MISAIEQGSADWHALRCGKVTASRIGDLMARTKTGPAASRENYMAELIAERLTGAPAASYVNAAMAWGTKQEPEARAMYEIVSGLNVTACDFAHHPKIANAGASPDGLAGDDGLVEIKCPNTATHIATLLGAEIDRRYRLQMQFQMACTGRKWCDFVSFDPRMPGDMQMTVERVERDDALIDQIESEVAAFLGELDAKVSALVARYRVKDAR